MADFLINKKTAPSQILFKEFDNVHIVVMRPQDFVCTPNNSENHEASPLLIEGRHL